MATPTKSFDLRRLLKQWFIIAIGVSLASWLNRGIQFESATSLILAVFFISALNVFIKPVLVFFGLPFIVMTLGLGLLLINALIFAMAGSLVPGFHVYGFGSAFWGAVIVSFTTLLANVVLARPKITYSRVNTPQASNLKGGPKKYRGKLDDVIDV